MEEVNNIPAMAVIVKKANTRWYKRPAKSNFIRISKNAKVKTPAIAVPVTKSDMCNASIY